MSYGVASLIPMRFSGTLTPLSISSAQAKSTCSVVKVLRSNHWFSVLLLSMWSIDCILMTLFHVICIVVRCQMITFPKEDGVKEYAEKEFHCSTVTNIYSVNSWCISISCVVQLISKLKLAVQDMFKPSIWKMTSSTQQPERCSASWQGYDLMIIYAFL